MVRRWGGQGGDGFSSFSSFKKCFSLQPLIQRDLLLNSDKRFDYLPYQIAVS